MISYYDEIIISELICFEGKLAFVSEKSPFAYSTSKNISDIGQIEQFYITDVKKSFSSFIHITSLDYNEFKKKYEIEKLNNLLSNPQKPSIINITRNSRLKKQELVQLIEEKLPCNLINYFISRFGLLLVFQKFEFENSLFSKKLIEKCLNNGKENLLPFSLKTKYEISDKTFIWLFYPEDLFLIHNRSLFEEYLGYYDKKLLFKPFFESRIKIINPSFEIIEKINPSFIPSVYFSIDKDNFALNFFNDKKIESYESKNIEKVYKDYIKIAQEIYKKFY